MYARLVARSKLAEGVVSDRAVVEQRGSPCHLRIDPAEIERTEIKFVDKNVKSYEPD
jgi:hypothetical protein